MIRANPVHNWSLEDTSKQALLYLDYCNLIWVTNHTFRLQASIALQKCAIQVLAGAAYGFHTNPPVSNFRLFRLIRIRFLQTGEFVFRYEHGLCHIHIVFFTSASARNSHLTRSSYSNSKILLPYQHSSIIHYVYWYDYLEGDPSRNQEFFLTVLIYD